MAKKIRYYGEDEKTALAIYRNADGLLYVAIEDEQEMTSHYVALPIEDAQEIITDLARDFKMLQED